MKPHPFLSHSSEARFSPAFCTAQPVLSPGSAPPQAHARPMAGAHRASLRPLPRPRRTAPRSRDGGAGLAAQAHAQSPPRPQALCKVGGGRV